MEIPLLLTCANHVFVLTERYSILWGYLHHWLIYGEDLNWDPPLKPDSQLAKTVIRSLSFALTIFLNYSN